MMEEKFKHLTHSQMFLFGEVCTEPYDSVVSFVTSTDGTTCTL